MRSAAVTVVVVVARVPATVGAGKVMARVVAMMVAATLVLVAVAILLVEVRLVLLVEVRAVAKAVPRGAKVVLLKEVVLTVRVVVETVADVQVMVAWAGS